MRGEVPAVENGPDLTSAIGLQAAGRERKHRAQSGASLEMTAVLTDKVPNHELANNKTSLSFWNFLGVSSC